MNLPFSERPAPYIAPSVLSCDFLKLGLELKSLENIGADIVHLDIMDGHFVPNISFGPPLVSAVRKGTGLPLIAHLMVTDPLFYANKMADNNVDGISFHLEAVEDPYYVLKRIKETTDFVGCAIKPSTHINYPEKLLENFDFILVMSVEPGFSGQKFMEVALPKIELLSNLKSKLGLKEKLIEVDGGVNGETAQLCMNAGADILVSASFIFEKKTDEERKKALLDLRGYKHPKEKI